MPNQVSWRWCAKCQGLFYAAQNQGPFKGVCPAGGPHEDDNRFHPSAAYSVPVDVGGIATPGYACRRRLFEGFVRDSLALFAWEFIRRDSFVIVTAAEARMDGPDPAANPPQRFTGNARGFHVTDIVPQDGAVSFGVHWDGAEYGDFPTLNVWVDVIVFGTSSPLLAD